MESNQIRGYAQGAEKRWGPFLVPFRGGLNTNFSFPGGFLDREIDRFSPAAWVGVPDVAAVTFATIQDPPNPAQVRTVICRGSHPGQDLKRCQSQ